MKTIAYSNQDIAPLAATGQQAKHMLDRLFQEFWVVDRYFLIIVTLNVQFGKYLPKQLILMSLGAIIPP